MFPDPSQSHSRGTLQPSTHSTTAISNSPSPTSSDPDYDQARHEDCLSSPSQALSRSGRSEQEAVVESGEMSNGLQKEAGVQEDEGATPRRPRLMTTAIQKSKLKALIARSPFPSAAERESVALETGMSTRRVQIYLQNQRRHSQKRPRALPANDNTRNPNETPLIVYHPLHNHPSPNPESHAQHWNSSSTTRWRNGATTDGPSDNDPSQSFLRRTERDDFGGEDYAAAGSSREQKREVGMRRSVDDGAYRESIGGVRRNREKEKTWDDRDGEEDERYMRPDDEERPNFALIPSRQSSTSLEHYSTSPATSRPSTAAPKILCASSYSDFTSMTSSHLSELGVHETTLLSPPLSPRPPLGRRQTTNSRDPQTDYFQLAPILRRVPSESVSLNMPGINLPSIDSEGHYGEQN